MTFTAGRICLFWGKKKKKHHGVWLDTGSPTKQAEEVTNAHNMFNEHRRLGGSVRHARIQ